MRLLAGTAVLLIAFVASPPPTFAQDDLVTPVRVGRADAPIKLTMWAQHDYSHLDAREEVASIFHDIFEQYARTHPDVQIEVSVMPALELHKAKLLLAAAAGRLPDVASVDSFWMPLFLERGDVQPLDPYWPAEDRADFLPFTISTLSDRQGHVYGMWHGTDCRVLYYRTDLVPTPPRSWDELLAAASRISREKHIAGYLYNAGRWEATVFDHLPMFWAQGGALVDGDGQPIFGLPPNRDRMIKLLRFLRATIETGASPSSVLANNDYQQLSSAAVSGDVAMFLGGSWQLRELEFALAPQEFAKWAIADIPQADPATRSTGTGGWVWVTFARDPVKQKAATELLRFIESPENVARISIPTRQLPVRKSVYRDFPIFRENKWYAQFGQMLLNGRARPAVPIYPAISEQLQLAIGAVVSGAKSPEAAVDDAFRAVQTIAQRQRQRSAGERRTFDPITWAPPIAAALVCVWLLWGTRRSAKSTAAGEVPGRSERPTQATLPGGRRTAHTAIWLAPVLVLVSVFLLYPVFDLFRLAATDARAYDNRYSYGVQTFARLATDPEFRSMLVVTLTFVVASVVVQIGIGFGVALLIDTARRRRAKGTAVARAAIVSAWVIPGVLVGVLWRILLMENRAGIANYVLSFLHLGPLPFLSSARAALVSLIVANAWRGCAFSMILQYAGLQRIPRELHEAADLEGASLWQRLRSVVLPEIAPVLALNLALITIATFNTFDLVLPLTGGGPGRATEVVSLYMYRSAFFSLESGRAAAVAVVMLVVNVVLAIAALKLVRRRADA